MDTVVTGVDGSPESRAALHQAARFATAMDARLRVVCIYGPSEERNPHSMPSDAYTSVNQIAQQARRADEWRQTQERFDYQAAEQRIRRMVDELDDDIRPGVIEEIAVEGTRPARVLIDLAREADLLVVGSRGLGGFKGLVLGSVSQQLANHAPCSLLIARANDVE